VAVREIDRRVLAKEKVEVVTLADDFASLHLVQQPMVVFGAKTAEERKLVADWHDAVIENETREHAQRERDFVDACQARGHDVEPLKAKVVARAGTPIVAVNTEEKQGCEPCGKAK
jgi:hypothetical protein